MNRPLVENSNSAEVLGRMIEVVRARLRVGFLGHSQSVKHAIQAAARGEQGRKGEPTLLSETQGGSEVAKALRASEKLEDEVWRDLRAADLSLSPWSALVHRTGVNARELGLVALLCLVENDTEIARVMAHVSLDYAHQHVSNQSLKAVYGGDCDELLAPKGRLRQSQLIESVILSDSNPGELGRRFRVAADVAAFLLTGRYTMDEALCSAMRREGPASGLVRPPKGMVEDIVSSIQGLDSGVLALVGPIGHDPIALVADATENEPIGVCFHGETTDELKVASKQFQLALRAALVTGRDLVVELEARLVAHEAFIDFLVKGANWLGRPVFLATRKTPSALYGRVEVREVAIPTPSDAFRLKLLVRALPKNVTIEDAQGFDVALRSLAIPPNLLVGAVEHAASELRLGAKQGQGTRQSKKRHASLPLSLERLVKAMRTQLTTTIGEYAHVMSVSHGWEDLQLQAAPKESLREVVTAYRHRHQVLGKWGFGGDGLGGLGITALFYGPPGTGKTMAAGIVAAELGLEIFRIDLSRVVDKYIGETEKALAKVFDEAERGEVVLLFDEADSLFGKRTEVKSSTDRYGNLEVNYLLQRMEAYDGVVILTTNHQGHLDPAFKRRLRYQIHFALPGAEQRQEIWQRLIPAEAPMAEGIDFEDLAYRFEMTGGHIRNAVLTAAILGARDSADINQAHLVAAANREYRALGKLVREIE